MATDVSGGLAEPVHAGAAGPGDPPWRDNAFVAFWDESSGLYGCAHVSTSPNSDGRRARCSVAAGGRSYEVVEDLAPDTFDSRSITLDLAGRLIVDSDDLRLDLRSTPRFAVADYSAGQIVPGLVPGAPLRHFQQGRCGPTMSSYDDFVPLATSAGDVGFGMVEQGIIRTVF